MKIQSGWAADTNLIARLQFYETSVDTNPANENYSISYFRLNIWLTLYLQHLQHQFSNMTAGIFPNCEKTNTFQRRVQSFAIPKASRDASVRSPPMGSQKTLPSEHPKPHRIGRFACSCREPALNFSGQLCKHLGLISA